MYVVGPFLWDKEVSGWKFKWNKNVNTSGGLVICIPTGTEALGKRFSIYAAGGPVASLCSALFLAGMYLLCARLSLDSYLGQTVTYFFLLLAFLSTIIFAVTSIPLHAGGFSSDGARIIRLLRGGDTARFELLLLKFTSSTMAGIRPAQLDRAELEEAHTLAKKLEAPMGVYITYYFYQSAMDRQHWEEAEVYLNEYVNEAEAIPEGVRGSVWIEVALFNAMIKKDLATAEMHLNRYKPSALIPLSVEYATRAAIASLKNEREEADHWIIKSQQAIPNMIDRGGALVLQDHLNRIKSMR
jgi:hypothetical protein